LDAEYYQPKYEEIENIIKKHPCETVEQFCTHVNYGTVPTSPYTEDGGGIPYIKGMNLKHLEITHKLDRIINTEKLPDKVYSKEGDIIISQMGTVGDVGIVTKNEEGYLFASFTIRIRIKDKNKYNPYYVGLYIQNIAKQYYLLRNIAQASVRQNTDLPTIKNMYVPIIAYQTQQQIAELIEKSFYLCGESKRLLEEAKDMVEKEIERK
jgi:restriction endonuclease S subunit